MTVLEDAIIVINHSNDFNARMYVITLFLIFHIFLFLTVKNWKEEKEWQRAMKFFFRIYSFPMIILAGIYTPLYLSPEATLDIVIENILNIYQFGIYGAGVLTIIWFLDLFKDIITKLTGLNLNRFDIFPRMRGKRKKW